MQLQVII